MPTLLRHLGVLVITLLAWMIVNDGFVQPWKVRASVADMQDIEVYILGDSHGKRINLPGACNLSRDGDPLWLQHATLTELRNNGLNPEVVVVSVNPVSMAFNVVERFQTDRSLLASKSARIALLHPLSEDLEGLFGWQLVWRLTGELQAKHWRVPWTAGGHRLKRETRDLEDAAERVEFLGLNTKNWFTKHRLTTAAIDSFANEANAGLFELHLIGTPLHPSLFERIEPDGLEQYDVWLRSLESEQVTYHSHERLSLPDSMFRDLNHLNQNGIEAFTKLLLSEL